MKKVKANEIPMQEDFLVFDKKNYKAIFSTAVNGRNFNRHTEDGVSELEKLKDEFDLDGLIYIRQTHSDNVITYHKGEDEAVFREKEGDAIITSQKNIAVGVFTADCTPVLLVDKTRNVVAAVHSGWKGTYKSITLKTIKKMISEFSCKVQDIEVFIGPHIKKCCYEVSEELKEKFIKEKNNILESELFNGRNLSMEACILSDLKKCNIDDKNITILDECTYCSKGIKLHSYRRTNGDYGRLFSFIFTR